MSNLSDLQKKVLAEIVATADDVNTYLSHEEVPMECMPIDVDIKLQRLHQRVKELFVEAEKKQTSIR